MPYSRGDRPRPSRRPVAVTGFGLVSPMGSGCGANAEGFRGGRVALREVTLFDVSGQRASRAGEIDLPDGPPPGALPVREAGRIDRATAMLLHAAAEAVAASGWERPPVGTIAAPVVLGTSAGAMALGEAFYKAATARRSRRGQAARVDGYQTQRQGRYLCDAFGFSGPVTFISNACASGANAIGEAGELVATGRADRVVAGGYDALCQLVFAGFDSLQALSPTAPRPFAADRDGLALGEGAAVFCLEPLEAARGRGARVLAELAGYAAATDRHHLTQPHPQGDAALRTMRAACERAGCVPAEVGYINSHGTGTPLNDSAEAHAICRWAGPAVGGVPTSSTKGSIGHLLGGAGAVEAAIVLLAMQGGWLPPNVAVGERDPACGFDLVEGPRDAPDLRIALTNSFGFGGANATLVFRKPDPEDD